MQKKRRRVALLFGSFVVLIISIFFIYPHYQLSKPYSLKNISESDSIVLQKDFGVGLQNNGKIIKATNNRDMVEIEIKIDTSDWELLLKKSFDFKITSEELNQLIAEISNIPNVNKDNTNMYNLLYSQNGINTYIYKNENQYYIKMQKRSFDNKEIYNMSWK